MAKTSLSLITYELPHRKTQEVLFKILRRGEFTVSLAVVPFKQRPERETRIRHRPDQFSGPGARALARAFNLVCRPIEDWRAFHRSVDYFLICTGTLIEPEFCSAATIINCHPGLVPESRGLDAFKWAIYHGRSLGNTLHVIDEDIDAGRILHQERTSVFEEDDLDTLARRHYEAELDLLAYFDRYLQGGAPFELSVQEPTKRMPTQLEAETIRRFDQYKRHALTLRPFS
jgi:phosphoribosylglycinamide formyltransferase-1